MLDENVKSLDEQSVGLMGIAIHVRGTDWPECPFYGADTNGVYIRWNNSDCVQALGEVFSGFKDHETVEFWRPSYDIGQAMRLWKQYPPKTQWLELQIGEDGWTVKLLYHHETGYIHGFQTDDDHSESLAHAITKAWITAMEHS